MKSLSIHIVTIICVLSGIFTPEGNCQINNHIRYDSISMDNSKMVFLDSVVVVAKRKGFDVNTFIKLVRNDKTFYRAFKNIRFASYDFHNDIKYFDKKNNIIAEFVGDSRQYFQNKCRSSKDINVYIDKNMRKKNGEPKYYTSILYDRLFFTPVQICNQDTTASLDINSKRKSKIEKYVLELKKLLFIPGEKCDIPFIGNRTAIFSKEMIKYYDFYITHGEYKGIPCFIFTAKLKNNLNTFQASNTVIEYMSTYFQEKNLQVLYRDYYLKYNTMGYDFDVKMKIKLNKINSIYYPEFISYDGNWDIIFKSREKCKFTTSFSNIVYKY